MGHKQAGLKWCPDCDQILALAAFPQNPARSNGTGTYCNPCHMKRTRKTRYGLTEPERQEMLARQNHTCALCPRDLKKHTACVDHDHETGRIRGILCVQCNSALGKLGDSSERLERALAYVRCRCVPVPVLD